VGLYRDRCGGDVVSHEMNEEHEPYLVFRRHHDRPNQLFVYNFKYLGIVLSLAGDRALAESRACVEGKHKQIMCWFNLLHNYVNVIMTQANFLLFYCLKHT